MTASKRDRGRNSRPGDGPGDAIPPVASGVGAILSRVRRPNVALVAWRWRYELLCGGCLLVAGIWLTEQLRSGHLLTFWASMAVATASAGVACGWQPARRAAISRFWCVFTAHRVRTAFAQAWLTNRAGRIPAVVLTRPRPWGERVLLLCPAGISPQLLLSAEDILAAACLAREVRVSRHQNRAALVYVDVIRYPEGHPRRADVLPRGEQRTDAEPSGVIPLRPPTGDMDKSAA